MVGAAGREVMFASVTGCQEHCRTVCCIIPADVLRKGTRNFKTTSHDVMLVC